MGGMRRKTRSKLRKSPKEHGKINIRAFFRKFKLGERVCLKADPSYQNGMYLPRFHGKSGIVEGMQGKCYKIKFKDHKKEKVTIVHPVHLKPY